MSKLYNQIKYNVDKINSLYRNGLTLYRDTNFISLIDGDITLEWMAGGIRANDYPVNYLGETKVTFGAYSTRSYDYIIQDLYDKFAVCPSFIQIKDFVVSKNTCYEIEFNPKETGQEYEKNNVALKFGDNILYPHSIYNGEDKSIFRYWNVDVTPAPVYFEEGIFSHYEYNYNVGDKFHIESVDKKNPYFLGDCDLQVTNFSEEEVPVPYTFPTHYITIQYQIINISRQPSQIITEPKQYIKIKYHDDVLSIFNDEYEDLA